MSYGTPEYKELVDQWAIEKASESQANARRLEVERKLLAIVGIDLRESGTNNFPNNLKILTGLNATCDREKVAHLYNQFNYAPLSNYVFPFKIKYEPDLKKLEELRKNNTEIYNNYIADCVTIKPKKPAFEVKKK